MVTTCDDDSVSDDDQYMSESGNDVLMYEDFDELYVSPESRCVQFQPTRIIPEPTGTENEPVQQTEPIPQHQ